MLNAIGKRWWLVLLVALAALVASGTALAAQLEDDEVYRLAEGEVVEDDLYVTAREIYIDGTVDGDLVAAGAAVEVNGTVTGDVLVAGASIGINGEVQDDVRAAGAGVSVAGDIGDDLFASVGGGGNFPVPGLERDIEQGLDLSNETTIGGEAVVFGGQGFLRGTIEEGATIFMGSVTLAAQMDGDVRVAADTVEIDGSTIIDGTLLYTTDEPLSVPDGVATEVTYEPPPAPEDAASTTQLVLGWLWRTVLMMAGFALLTWLLLRFMPQLLTTPATSIQKRPAITGLAGLAAMLLFMIVPLASALLVFLMVVFWGWFPGIALGLFLFGGLALLWFLSPLVTGVWVGRLLNKFRKQSDEANLPILLAGVLLLVLLGRLPYIGWFVYLLSFVLALGGVVLMRYARTRTPVAPRTG